MQKIKDYKGPIVIIIAVIALIVFLSFFLNSALKNLKFEGKKQSVSQIEEIIEDRLEKENKGLQFDVDISLDTSKKKKVK